MGRRHRQETIRGISRHPATAIRDRSAASEPRPAKARSKKRIRRISASVIRLFASRHDGLRPRLIRPARASRLRLLTAAARSRQKAHDRQRIKRPSHDMVHRIRQGERSNAKKQRRHQRKRTPRDLELVLTRPLPLLQLVIERRELQLFRKRSVLPKRAGGRRYGDWCDGSG